MNSYRADKAPEPVIEVSSVNWWREERQILKSINWQVVAGEHWAILGRNGSGKTSLLQMVAGYLWPSSGTIKVLGNLYGTCDLREVRQSIGWVSEVLLEKLNGGNSVFQTVMSGKFASFGLFEAWGEKEEQEVLGLLGQLNMDGLASARLSQLSQGEKQKVLIARALMADPKLLILDEPCSGLDLYAREQLLQTVSRLGERKEGPTLLYVTHHIEEVLPVMSRVLLLSEGRIVTQGKKEEVLTDEMLSHAYRLPLHVEWAQGRAWVIVRSGRSIH